jgi:hypothetical protein
MDAKLASDTLFVLYILDGGKCLGWKRNYCVSPSSVTFSDESIEVLYEEVRKRRKLLIKKRKVNALFSEIQISWLLWCNVNNHNVCRFLFPWLSSHVILQIPAFQRNLLPPFSGQKMEEADSFQTLIPITPLPWRWKQHVLPKPW